MGRERGETQEQFERRLRYVKKERWFIDKVLPWIFLIFWMWFFMWPTGVDDEGYPREYPYDSRR